MASEARLSGRGAEMIAARVEFTNGDQPGVRLKAKP